MQYIIMLTIVLGLALVDFIFGFFPLRNTLFPTPYADTLTERKKLCYQ
jgi:hypothetical protein